MRRFRDEEHGYVLVFTLILLPVILAMGLFVVDIGRANNVHSDLQAAADAIALAGARELDGGADSIARAEAAMGELTNTVSYLSRASGTPLEVQYVDGDTTFLVYFLTDIPESDDTAITAEFVADHVTTDGFAASYIFVQAQSDDMETFFINPVNWVRPEIPIAAQAVATFRSAACDVTPLFVCNPFEGDIADLQQSFAAGALHGRLIKLHPKGSDTAAPGNFGFLQVLSDNGGTSASADAIRDIFAGERNPTCYDASRVTTKPGAASSIRQGINVRFDLYSGPYSPSEDYPPAENVRKGFVRAPTGPNNSCNLVQADPAWSDGTITYDQRDWASPFPEPSVLLPPGDGDGAAGAFVSADGEWDLNRYWTVNHPGTALTSTMIADMNSYPGTDPTADPGPSRYDVYRYEIENGLVGDDSAGAPTGVRYPSTGQPRPTTENGLPNCAAADDVAPSTGPKDRRTVFAAIVDCAAEADSGVDEMAVTAYASLFMTSPMLRDPADPSADSTIDVEIVDITGFGGNGTLDTFVRDEAILVR
ncbi:TadE/TadG family type IV pilus assembly protein [Thioclava sp. FR2]|uniref:TadE/TadG family type IV pilus assembly protein n=1 Tax=Thioclava sp. FR2 TaxID=3445780 RepID=UPI003EBAE0DC